MGYVSVILSTHTLLKCELKNPGGKRIYILPLPRAIITLSKPSLQGAFTTVPSPHVDWIRAALLEQLSKEGHKWMEDWKTHGVKVEVTGRRQIGLKWG
jgi:hypothetical protein